MFNYLNISADNISTRLLYQTNHSETKYDLEAIYTYKRHDSCTETFRYILETTNYENKSYVTSGAVSRSE